MSGSGYTCRCRGSAVAAESRLSIANPDLALSRLVGDEGYLTAVGAPRRVAVVGI